MKPLKSSFQSLKRHFSALPENLIFSQKNQVLSRRKFFFILSASVVTVAYNACAPGFVANPNGSSDLLSSSNGSDQPNPSEPNPNPNPVQNQDPVWEVVPTISFVQGVPARISIAPYVRDADGDSLTITKNMAALPPGVTYDPATKSFIYDGIGDVASTEGHILTATEG